MKSPSLALFALLAASASAQTWTQLTTPNTPTTRRSGALASGPVTGTVMYGGLQSGPTATLAEMLLWTGADWQPLVTPTAPPPRWGHRMVYDTHRHVMVTFGGRSPTTTATANDTWEYDGTDWQQVFPATSPNNRAFYSMAFDQRRGVTVLYGTQSGSVAGGGDQTWEYDGTTWTQATTATTPPGLETPAMAYDAARGVVVMFGGWNGTPPGTMYDQTWEYDGVDWTLRTTANAPSARYRAACCYDDVRGRIVLYGGFGSGTALNDTWEYDGNDWTQIAASGPLKSTESYMTWDGSLGLPLHFGGSGPTGVSNETWLYSAPIDAIAAPFGQGCATSQGVPTLDPATLPVLGTTYQLTGQNGTLTTLALVVYGFDNTVYGPGLYLPLDLTFLGLGGCRLEVTPDVFVTEVVAAGALNTALPLPNNAVLQGRPLFTQAVLLDDQAGNGFGGMSNAVHGRLGQ
ncbi:MAG: kelch repeat-containing protein [Planctomycetota bacterium]